MMGSIMNGLIFQNQLVKKKLQTHGIENACFDDIDYYEIFPADTIMHYSSKEGRSNG